MKRFKKMMAIAIVAVMTLMYVVPSMAATGDRNINTPISVTGLTEGDTVKAYQVVKWDNGNWAWASPYKDDNTFTADLLKTITEQGKVTSDLADKIAGVSNSTPAATGTADSTGKWSSGETKLGAGLYMVAVTAKESGVVYNPIFVSANYYNEIKDSANTIKVSEDLAYDGGSTAMVKKSVIDVEKTASGTDGTTGQSGDATNAAYTTDIGEEVTFTITTTIPLYADDYIKPQFRVKDSLVGMVLTSVPEVVKPASETVKSTVTKDGTTDSAAGDTAFVVEFDSDDIKAMTAAQEVQITYKAKITDAAAKTVNPDDNTVTVEYSNGPEDQTGAGRLKDKTNHWTFSIDAGLLGNPDNESSTEAIKVGVDKDGNPIESVKNTYSSGSKHPALDGAKFTLYTDSACSQKYQQNGVDYPEIESKDGGYLTITGLDAGNYWLKETSAPAGYVAYQNAIPIVITAKIVEEEVTETIDGQEVTYKTNKLESYTVTINGVETSYTVISNSKAIAESVSRDPSSSDSEIKNTKGVELPSTGGMGTTLFYIIGAILIIGAGVLLVTRRRTENAE